MMWKSPLALKMLPRMVDSNEHPPEGCTFLPLGSHQGAWGVRRSKHVHEGVDLYAPEGTPVYAVEDGFVSAVIPFTGPKAGLPWWLDTSAVLVEGASGVVLYGELEATVSPGDIISAGQPVGKVTRVLRKDKGRPVAMLHLELHRSGTLKSPEWELGAPKPASLKDPTPYLKHLAKEGNTL